MYSKFYGFSHKPFELTPDPDVIYLSETHQEALSVLRYGVLNRKGFLQITGDVGTGKSTLLQCLIRSLENNVHLCYIPNPNFTVHEFYYFLSAKFGLGEFDGNKAKFIISLGRFLEDCKANDEHVLLIVDEAQILSLEVLEEIRLISNQEGHDVFGVLSIFLVGQPEFRILLDHQKLLPLRNRIGISFHIEPLTLEETTAYIQYRVRMAGRNAVLFSQNAYQEIHKATGGIPRTINILCDNALLEGFAGQSGIIDEDIIKRCAVELNKTEKDFVEPEEKLKEATGNNKGSDAEHYEADNKKQNSTIWPGKVAIAVAAIFIVFVAMAATTEYWGRLPGAAPVKGWFDRLHIDERLLKPVKKIISSGRGKTALKSSEKLKLPEDVKGLSEYSTKNTGMESGDVYEPADLPDPGNDKENDISDKKKLLLTILGTRTGLKIRRLNHLRTISIMSV